jgi:hypothetical protein
LKESFEKGVGTMTTWNHRVICHNENSEEEIWFAIHECFYDKPGDDIPVSWTVDSIAPVSDTAHGLLEVIERMKLAVEKPILVIDGDKLKVRAAR